MNRPLNLKELGLLHTIEKCGGEITKKELYEITVPQRSGRDAYTRALRGLIMAGAVQVNKQRHAGDGGRFTCQTITLTAGR
jgi:hypothetical protein